MKIVGCDLHTRYQQIAMLDKETRELLERAWSMNHVSPLTYPVTIKVGQSWQHRVL